MTQDQFNGMVIEGLGLLQLHLATPEFEQVVLNGTPLDVDASFSTKPVEWTNHLQLMIYRKLGLEVGLLAAVREEVDGFHATYPEYQSDAVCSLTRSLLEKCSQVLRAQVHSCALAGCTQAQQLQGLRAQAAALLAQSRAHLAGAHAAPAQH